jgi:2-methylisocitrate lyase-like PEP mutase family enzyme
MPTPGEKLRALIENGDHFVAAEAYSALTGRIVEHVGFQAAYLGGHACSAFHYAVPDNGVFSQVEQIEQAGRIAQAMNIPLIADADTLGETVADAYHFTRRYVAAGIAGYHVEDEVNPKHSKHVNGLCSIQDMQLRIEAGVKARGDSGLVIIARCDDYTPAPTAAEARARSRRRSSAVRLMLKRAQTPSSLPARRPSNRCRSFRT